jgi:hypothetical protein
MTIIGFLSHTPPWVFVLLAYFVWRGVRAMRPADVTLPKLALLPAILTVWGGYELIRVYGLAPDVCGIWAAGLLIGIFIGFLVLRDAAISADPASGIIHRPADFTVLPLILVIFAVKYAFGAMAVINPAMLQEFSMRLADLGLSGVFTGIFIGKFAVYALRYLSARTAVQS